MRTRHSSSKKFRQINDETIELFCSKYIELGCNGSAAYREIHPAASPNTAKVEAHRYLTNPNVQDVLQPMLQRLLKEVSVDRDWVVRRWREQADASALDYFIQTPDGQLELRDISELSDAMRRNLKSIQISKTENGESISVTVVDQQRAVGMFAKYIQMFKRMPDAGNCERIGDLIEQGVKRIRKCRDLDAWKTEAMDDEFNDLD